MEKKRYYTVSEINLMIPKIETAFNLILQLRMQIIPLLTQLENAGFAPKNDDFDVTPEGATSEIIDHLTSLKTLIDELKNQVILIDEQGGIIKDLEQGLIDWHGKNGNDEIYLCWRYGEKAVSYWHPLDKGVDSRRPISEILS